MSEHMNMEQYRKETGAPVVRLGAHMTVEEYWKENGVIHTAKEMRERSGKYNAKRTEYNGRMFDSKAEASMAQELDNARHSPVPAEKVISVEYQRPFPLHVNGALICTYIADFVVTYGDGQTKVIDAKGVLTPVYKLKKKLMLACLGIEVKETL